MPHHLHVNFTFHHAYTHSTGYVHCASSMAEEGEGTYVGDVAHQPESAIADAAYMNHMHNMEEKEERGKSPCPHPPTP